MIEKVIYYNNNKKIKECKKKFPCLH